MGEFPMGCLAEEIDTPDSADGARVRALITIASNPVLSAPNPENIGYLRTKREKMGHLIENLDD